MSVHTLRPTRLASRVHDVRPEFWAYIEQKCYAQSMQIASLRHIGRFAGFMLRDAGGSALNYVAVANAEAAKPPKTEMVSPSP